MGQRMTPETFTVWLKGWVSAVEASCNQPTPAQFEILVQALESVVPEEEYQVDPEATGINLRLPEPPEEE